MSWTSQNNKDDVDVATTAYCTSVSYRMWYMLTTTTFTLCLSKDHGNMYIAAEHEQLCLLQQNISSRWMEANHTFLADAW